MIYRKKNRPQKIIQISVVVLVVLIVVLGFLRVAFINNIFEVITIPFSKVASIVRAPFSDEGGFFSTKQGLANRVNELEDEINSLQIDLIKKQILETENRDLRDLAENSVSGVEDILMSKVLLRPPYSPYDTFTLDRGSDMGVTMDARIFYKDVFLGHVSDLSGKSSIVRLLSSPKVETPVRVNGSVEAVAVGQGGGRLNITLPKDTLVSVGDVVTAPDSEISIIGTVSHIVVDEVDSFQTLFVSLPVALSSISFVEIVE